ncbi:CHAT domain-containing protein [Merismopedia glauca]|uniref:FHA domain-containing protein n=1 Tax=Merismopedia glauca CCAP 1448/3 TaxID=1296344 RepID=A0A2T1C5G6_9CYAN|nr:CHAT domain-containing protein [Merismopedia glauca]PSB03509.1 hypothetical protein C7B64_08065 [Merismopedia glauca CCAP 1448/3]
MSENPCLWLAIDRLQIGADNFAIRVVKAPFLGGHVLYDCNWSEALTQNWVHWQQMFKSRGLPHVPFVHHVTQSAATFPPNPNSSAGEQLPYTSRLMQTLGINLWQWLFTGVIQNCLAQSRGFASGKNQPLRLRLEIRDPDLIPLPWEIMQEQAGTPAISLAPQILFSRTTSDVESLKLSTSDLALNVLLVLGKDIDSNSGLTAKLKLQKEATALSGILQSQSDLGLPSYISPNLVPCRVEPLLQPSRAELLNALNTKKYNVLFYAGHGTTAPDGGLLYLSPDATINGTELAQALVSCQVKLAVLNACWGAQPDEERQKAIPRSSLAEVLIHHGVPAVLGMRDSIADEEALSFIQTFAQALRERMPIDQAVAIARQQLLTLYKFNQPAWTLPVLYMHPEFDGELVKNPTRQEEKPETNRITEIPTVLPIKPITNTNRIPDACLRSTDGTNTVWAVRQGRIRLGRVRNDTNDVVISNEQWVSQEHAEIIYREYGPESLYYLRDFSRFGTFIWSERGWQKINNQEVPLPSGTKLKFGSTQGQTLEFITYDYPTTESG